jgi:Tfp pilus assembly protein PilV
MKRVNRKAGMTLLELIVVSFILMLSGLALLGFIRTTYNAQDTISGQNSADTNARQVLDVLADNIRNAQWFDPYDPGCQAGCGSGYKTAVIAGTATSITVYNFDPATGITDGTRYTQFSLSGTNLQKSVNGGAATTILSGVQSLTLDYYRSNSYVTPITLPLAVDGSDYPQIWAIRITATVSVSQMSSYTSQYQTFVRLRNSPTLP